MKTCVVYGDMTSDKSSEAYPMMQLCDECYESMDPEGEDSRIVSTERYNSSLGDTCENCGKTAKQESQE